MKALYYYVINNNTKKFYNMGCNGSRHNAILAAESKLVELKQVDPKGSYKIVTKIGKI